VVHSLQLSKPMSGNSTRLLPIVLSVLIAGCGSDAATDPDPGPDLSDAVYDPDRLLDISIEMAPADWDELRGQTRSLFDVLGSSCLAEPPEKPFTYFPATVTIDGEVIDNVGVRKKGFFGSLSNTKPSLKVKFSEYDDLQRWSSLKRLTLNNAISDKSYVKQCLGYSVFAAAGVPSPRCNFATVTVNGDNLGVFANVEGIKKKFLKRHFEDNDGNLYEGALSDFRTGWVDTFQKKTNKEILDRSDIEALVPAFGVADANLISSVEQHVDIDAFMTFWAAELLISHPDGYARNTNNFYMYNDPTTGLWSFIPWGIDSIFADVDMLPWEDQASPQAAWAEGALTRRLYQLPETRAQYYDKLQSLLDNVWDETALIADLDRMVVLIRPHIRGDELAGFDAAVDVVRNYIDDRRNSLEADLSLPEADWSGPLRDPWCIDPIGTMSASFDTTWDTLGTADALNTGAATLAIDVTDKVLVPTNLGAVAGIDKDSGNPAIQVVTLLEDGTALVIQAAVDSRFFEPGVSLPIDWVAVTGIAIQVTFPPDGSEAQIEILGMIGDGTLELDAASTDPDAPITGRIVGGVVYESLF
jgi:hypothetical protein